MTSISPYYGGYIPSPLPPPPPPAPVPTNPDGTPKPTEVVVVIGRRPLMRQPFGKSAYGGLTGVQENDRQMALWAQMSPAQRAESMGLSSVASIKPLGEEAFPLEGKDGLVDIADYSWSPAIDVATLIREAVTEQYKQSIDNQITGKVGERAAELHVEAKGLQLLAKQVRVIIMDENNQPRVRIYDMLVADQFGNKKFIEVKANGGIRDRRQEEADRLIGINGARIATSNPDAVIAFPNGIPATTVEVWNVLLPPKGT